MNDSAKPSNRRDPRQPFTLYLQEGRILAGNRDGKLIELGPTESNNGRLSYRLDGEPISGDGLQDEAALLADLGGKLNFLFLDSQFTALPDLGDSIEIQGASQLYITLEEFSGDDSADPLAQHVLAEGMDESATSIPPGLKH